MGGVSAVPAAWVHLPADYGLRRRARSAVIEPLRISGSANAAVDLGAVGRMPCGGIEDVRVAGSCGILGRWLLPCLI